MSGSEFERENIVMDALSAAPASKPDEALGEQGLREHSWRPPAEGLYDPSLERDSCGVGFIANIKGKKSRQIVSDAINILCNLEHRGAVGADPRAGDGAGILVQIPHAFFLRKAAEIGFQLPKPGDYAVGALFMPKETAWRKVITSIIADQIKAEQLTLLGWRDVPTDNSSLGETVKPTEPANMQVFIGRGAHIKSEDDFERRLYILRKSISQAIYLRRDRGLAGYYPASMSCRTVIYKGMFLADQLGKYYPDLHEPDFESALCLVHQRFSTNTFPSWSLAHPYRYIAHNGEINTLKGNVNWMYARQSILSSPLFGDDIKKLFPIVTPGGSDSATFDNVLELLYLAGREIPHAMAMLIPEAWASNEHMNPEKKAFYEYHASLMEPWDGPAAIAFTDGRVIGATLDRNGLRPARYLVTHDDLVVMASETGVLPIKPEEVRLKGRLQPGKMFLVDTVAGEIVPDKELKRRLYSRQPYAQWLKENQIHLDDLPEPPRIYGYDPETILMRQRAFGYTDEDIRILMAPMAAKGEEPVGSMGIDTPLACLSDKPQPLFNYFKQLFAQVTNPPIDPIREEMVMSLISYIGTERNILDETPKHCHTMRMPHPILTNRDLERLRRVSQGDLLCTTLPALFRAEGGEKELERSLDGLCRRASLAIKNGYSMIILSDRGVDDQYAPIPSLLALTAVHNHLIREKTRTQVALMIESGEPREVMHFCLLIGYGASAINPYLAIETLEGMAVRGNLGVPFETALKHYKKAINKGLLKVFSKMGISTLQSYRGAQVFEAIGLNKALVGKYFTGTASRIEGVGLDVLAREAKLKHDHSLE